MPPIRNRRMLSEEPESPTPCAVGDSEDWFPDEHNSGDRAIAACWTCHFQSACARRVLTLRPAPEYGIWAGYRLVSGRNLQRTLAQLEIVAGWAEGPAIPPHLLESKAARRRRRRELRRAS